MAKFNVASHTRRGKRKKKELSAFLVRLGKSKRPGILKTVKVVDAAVWQNVDCLDCANCCKKMTPTYTKKDINRISKHFNQTYKEFYKKWLMKDRNGDIVNKSTPCQFLGKDHKCSIYSIRPDDCAQFPHITRRDFNYQASEKVYSNNVTFCPATLVFVEKLKETIEADL